MTVELPLSRSRLEFRVGITGHRLNKLPPGSRPAVRLALAQTLALLDKEIGQSGPGSPAPDGSPARIGSCIVSALAEGVDRIAVQVAPPGWRLEALLPMPRSDYELDFLAEGETGSTSLDEFRSLIGRAALVTELPALGGEHAATGPGRSQQYAMLGTHLVGQIDLLLAVWDGQAAEGPGGTATVVAEAVGRGVGIVWIDPRRPEHPTILTGFEDGDLARPRLRDLDRESVRTLLSPVHGRSLDPTA